MSLLHLSADEFLKRLASKEPTPGGGAVAALTGALAAALGRMVAAYTLGKPKFAAVETRVREIDERLTRASELLRKLVDEDAAAYGVLNDAFKLDKHDPQRKGRVESAASLAGGVPLETAAISARVLSDLETLREIGNPMLRSDAEAGAQLAQAAVHAAAANVRANLNLMAPDEAAEVDQQLTAIVEGLLRS